MADLRAELGATPSPALPEFSLVLPSGWEEFEPTAAVERELLDRARGRLQAAHRPDLLAQLRAITGKAFGGMRSSDTVRFYAQTQAWGDDLLLPLSITASVRRAPGGGSLSSLVADLIRSKGATALHDDKRFVRWESSSPIEMGTATLQQYSTAYLTPVPGSEHRAALQLTAVVAAPADGTVARTDPFVSQMFLLTDAIVSTLRWNA
ncbi:hypothetical protein [Microbacterium hibisci]|uniref:hypothetical protein n=1 Tax=Microbacterium hibisci TaxID=2036000 RepID=UPI0019450662|nr:hypothetical protein [Microbacterium hibisci]